MAGRNIGQAAYEWVPVVGELVYPTDTPKRVGIVVHITPHHSYAPFAKVVVEFPDGRRATVEAAFLGSADRRVIALQRRLQREIDARDHAAAAFAGRVVVNPESVA